MQLIKALRLGETPRLALVGAGGKTTALFQIARGLLGRPHAHSVFVTASTHLATSQLAYADHHITATSLTDLAHLDGGLPDGLVLVTGPVGDEPDRTTGLSPALLERMMALSEAGSVPLLVEADGARGRMPWVSSHTKA